jgi:hypothetical protein
MATGLRFKLGGDKIGDTIRLRYQQQQLRIADAARHAMNEARDRIITAGREDIKRGGKFGARWTTGLQGTVEPQGVRTSNLTLSISQAVPYWRVFEYSARIFGKPLLWIPLPWNPIKVRAREFPGRLFRVNRKGKNPLLMQRQGKKAIALYVGVKSVFLKRRFHLRTIIARVSKQMPALFRKSKRLAGVK